jgi:hypothetical protein
MEEREREAPGGMGEVLSQVGNRGIHRGPPMKLLVNRINSLYFDFNLLCLVFSLWVTLSGSGETHLDLDSAGEGAAH